MKGKRSGALGGLVVDVKKRFRKSRGLIWFEVLELDRGHTFFP